MDKATLLSKYLKHELNAEEEATFKALLEVDAELQEEVNFALFFKSGHQFSRKNAIAEAVAAELQADAINVTPKYPIYYPKIQEQFERWLWRSMQSLKGGFEMGTTPVIVSSFSLGALLFFNGIFQWFGEQVDDSGNWFSWINSFSVQVGIISMVVYWLYFIAPKPKYYFVANRASLALGQFWNWWRRIWLFWLFLYLSLSITYYWKSHGLYPSTDALMDILIHLFNNLSTVTIFICYDIIQKDTIRTKSNREVTSKEERIKVVLPGMDEAFDAEEIIGSNIKLGKYFFLLVLLSGSELVLYLAKAYTPDAQQIFGLISGILGGLALSAFFSKLNSKYLNIPQRIFYLLILYVIIQPLFPFLDHSSNSGFQDPNFGKAVSLIFSNLALILKLLLLFLMQWLIYSNQLLYYFGVSVHLNKDVEKHRLKTLKKIKAAEPVSYESLWNVKKS